MTAMADITPAPEAPARRTKKRGLRPKAEKLVVGWREWVGLPDLQVPRILAKIDTGARSSALHAPHAVVVERDGEKWVNFDLALVEEAHDKTLRHWARLIDIRDVKSSSGHVERRYMVKTTLLLGGRRWTIDVTLTDRSDMEIPMLLGRSAMKRRLLVDPSGSFRAADPDTFTR